MMTKRELYNNVVILAAQACIPLSDHELVDKGRVTLPQAAGCHSHISKEPCTELQFLPCHASLTRGCREGFPL